MGRYDFSAQRVHQAATRFIESNPKRIRPTWYDTVSRIPPGGRLVRPALQAPRRQGRKASKMFQPVQLSYPEDKLRSEFFGDHPWELARPRIVLEEDGKDYQRRDWSSIEQTGKPLDGESVVQRQKWLMDNQDLSRAEAYDQARKEFYAIRHKEEVERRVAKEEALMTGAYFGKGPLEVGMELEDKSYEDWRQWALKEIATAKQMRSAAYTGISSQEDTASDDDPAALEATEDLEEGTPTKAKDA